MKKIFVILIAVAMVMALASCGSKNITMQNIVDSNKLEVLLKSYDNMYIREIVDGEVVSGSYITEECIYENFQSWSMYMTDDTCYGRFDGDYKRMVYMSPDGLIENADYRADMYEDIIVRKSSVNEKIQSITKKGDQITVVSVMEKKELNELWDAEEGLESVRFEYLLDAKTLRFISCAISWNYADGTKFDNIVECTYNAEMPEEVKPFVEYANQKDNLRTVTTVFNPGDENEKTEHLQAPKGMIIGLVPPADLTESFKIYKDAACTELFVDNGDYTSDITIYIKWDK